MRKLILENDSNKTTRVFIWNGQAAHVICRADNRRVELHQDLERLDHNHILYKKIGTVDPAKMSQGTMNLDKNIRLRLVDEVEHVEEAAPVTEDNRSALWTAVLLVLLFTGGFMTLLSRVPRESAKLEEELKQRVVQIVKKTPPKELKPMVKQEQATVKAETPKKFNGVKRLGALAVLGSLKSSNQKGGLNLNAVNTTAGPGLGGTGGSGGVQSSIYAKGITSAPLGAGANMAGGGGYGTKGKGGGQAGYGKVSLVGSAGNMPIPLGKEALIEGGLDLDMVSEVIRRNMGQIRFCYEQGLQLDPAIAGRVGVKFTIGGNGQVKIADVENTTLNSKQIEDCILLRLRSWKFPLPDGGVDVKVSYPFSFKRTGNS